MPFASGLSALLAELRRRRVFRVALVYVVVAWAVIEVSETTLPYLGAPDWVVATVIVLALVGFPVALVLGWAFDLTSAGVERTGPPSSVPSSDASETRTFVLGSRRWTTWAGVGGLVLLVSLLMAAGHFLRDAPEALDPDLVVVIPFRVADSSVDYLGEGMLDLLSAKLDGQVGPRAVDPRSVISLLNRRAGADADGLELGSALQIASDLGAGLLLLGEVVNVRPHLMINASLVDVASGRVTVRTSVEGPLERVPVLVDQLVAALLSLEAGEELHRLQALTSTSLPALRAFLDGQAARRQGRYHEARAHFERALEMDSTFALAALRLDRTANWIGGLGDVRARAIRLAWAEKDRLSPRDRALVVAVAGAEYPAYSSAAEQLAAWERAVEAAPDQPERWVEYADILFHFGRALGLDDPEARAKSAFLRALELDQEFTEPLHHLVMLAALQGDTVGVRAYGTRYLAVDPLGDGADYIQWRMAVALADSEELARVRSRFGSMSTLALTWILISAQEEGIEVEDAERALQVLTDRATTSGERFTVLVARNQLAHNRGSTAAGLAAARAMAEVLPSSREHLWQQIQNGLFWEGDPSAGAAAVQESAVWADAPLDLDPQVRAAQYEDICFVELWRLYHGQVGTAASNLEKLRQADAATDSPLSVAEARLCAALLGALLSQVEGRPDARLKARALDSYMRTFPPGRHNWYGNLVVARILEEQGELSLALAAVRRRPFRGRLSPSFLSTFLLEEARLAGLVEDADGAARAWERLRVLRTDTGEDESPPYVLDDSAGGKGHQ